MSQPDLPQFGGPFRLGRDGKPVTVQQDTPEEIGAAIYNIVTCPQGAKFGDPEFGVPSLLFQTAPLNMDALIAAVQRWEPRASLAVSEHADALSQAIRDVALVGVITTQ